MRPALVALFALWLVFPQNNTPENLQPLLYNVSSAYARLEPQVIRPAESYFKYNYLIPAGFYKHRSTIAGETRRLMRSRMNVHQFDLDVSVTQPGDDFPGAGDRDTGSAVGVALPRTGAHDAYQISSNDITT
jgi:hypothetical protein